MFVGCCCLGGWGNHVSRYTQTDAGKRLLVEYTFRCTVCDDSDDNDIVMLAQLWLYKKLYSCSIGFDFPYCDFCHVCKIELLLLQRVWSVEKYKAHASTIWIFIDSIRTQHSQVLSWHITTSSVLGDAINCIHAHIRVVQKHGMSRRWNRLSAMSTSLSRSLSLLSSPYVSLCISLKVEAYPKSCS